MSDWTITCFHCGHSNSIHRVWCEECGEPIPYPSKPPAVNDDPSAQSRAQLYEKILEDLERLFRDQKVEHDTYAAIKTLYQVQLAQIVEQAAERERADQLHQLVVAARNAAQAGRFQAAIGFLQQGLALDRDKHLLEQAMAEVNARSQQRERALQASREVDALLREATASTTAGQLGQAKDQLERAKRLDPNSSRITDRLRRVRAQITEQRARELTEQVSPQDDREEILVAELVEEPQLPAASLPAASVEQAPRESQPVRREPAAADTASRRSDEARIAAARFDDEREELASPRHRFIEAASQWSSIVKPFLLDNVGWFVGAFLVVAGFVVLIFTFWGSIEQNRILMHSLVYFSLLATTGMFFAAAYFMRLKYPQLQNSSDVLLVIVALLIPLVFAAALLTSLVPVAAADLALVPYPG